MRGSDSYLSIKTFTFVSGALCLLYCFLFSPITYEAQGDSPAYIELARQIFDLPGAGTTDLSARSPLYSVIIGIFILVFGEAGYLIPLMTFQYFLIFLSSLFIYKIFLQLTGKRGVAFFAGLTGILNLTTIFFGFMILSETLALFLFTLTAWLLMKYYQEEGTGIVILTGLVMGMLILARYNMIGMPVVVAGLLIIVFVFKKHKGGLSQALRDLSLFVVSMLLILNIWAFRNYLTNDRYELLPRHHTGQRWAVPATINPSDSVSNEYSEVLQIFLKTREDLLVRAENRQYRKSSLLEYNIIEKINDYFRPAVSGYLLYRDSEEELLNYYHLEINPEGIRALNARLKPFYDEIAAQNRKEIRRFRTYSFLYSFKHISPTLPGNAPANLNILPSFILKAYKVIFILMMVMVFAGSVIHTVYILLRREKFSRSLEWIILYGIIWYFPVVNWYANVLGDANRFRYPADMVITGLFISYIWVFYRRFFRSENPQIHSGT